MAIFRPEAHDAARPGGELAALGSRMTAWYQPRDWSPMGPTQPDVMVTFVTETAAGRTLVAAAGN
jgi:hypothetical protein